MERIDFKPEPVIEAFGGTTALAKALGHKYPTTVQGWKSRGRVPGVWRPWIEWAAQEKEIEVGFHDTGLD